MCNFLKLCFNAGHVAGIGYGRTISRLEAHILLCKDDDVLAQHCGMLTSHDTTQHDVIVVLLRCIRMLFGQLVSHFASHVPLQFIQRTPDRVVAESRKTRGKLLFGT